MIYAALIISSLVCYMVGYAHAYDTVADAEDDDRSGLERLIDTHL